MSLYFTNSNERKISIGLAVTFYEKLFLDFQLHPIKQASYGVLYPRAKEIVDTEKGGVPRH